VVCPKDDITVTDSSEGVISTYTWNFGLDASPAIGNGIGPHTFNYSTPGVKTVSLIVVNSFGTDTFTREITVEPAAPANPVPFAHEDSVCKGTYTYTIPKVPDATSYLWMLSGGGSIVGANTDTTLTVKWLITGGPHEARVVALNSCGNSATVALPVTVFDKAVAGFTQSVDGRTVTFTNTSTHADSFQWYFGDGDSAMVKDPVHTYPHATTYNISLRAMNFCSESEKNGTAQTVNGAQILKLNAGMITGYPNPASGEWYVDLTQLQGENIVVEIAELSGKVLQRQPLKALKINRLDLSSLSAGQYLMNFSNGEQKLGTLRLIKQ
jgi:PKD repeat protein